MAFGRQTLQARTGSEAASVIVPVPARQNPAAHPAAKPQTNDFWGKAFGTGIRDKMKHNVLCIEDDAYQLVELIGPVVLDGAYDLVIALDASDAAKHIMETEFAAIITGIRLPPGGDKRWIDIYNSTGNESVSRLGILLLRSLLKPKESVVKLDVPAWIKPEVFGVFTVHDRSEIAAELDDLGIKVFRQKTRQARTTTLLELFQEVFAQAHS